MVFRVGRNDLGRCLGMAYEVVRVALGGSADGRAVGWHGRAWNMARPPARISSVELRSATSSSAQHSAANAVDGNAQSYWASGFDPNSAVDMILDFGAAKKIEKVEISWEYPPLVSFGALDAQGPTGSMNMGV